MAIPTDMLSRGCSAHLAQPVGQAGMREADELVQALFHYNQDRVVYRSSYNEEDILQHVFRWSSLPPEQVFQHGFQADAQGNTPDNIYYNIHEYVYNAGQPMNPHRNNFAFVSTTLSSAYVPQTRAYLDRMVYRYEIYAPGGVWVAQTLVNYGYPAQDEVIFVRGIDRQYIRSAQRFRLVDAGRGHLRRERVDQTLLINQYIDPASHPTRRLLEIQNPVDFCIINHRRVQLNVTYVDDMNRLQKRSVMTTEKSNNKNNASGTSIWYAERVPNIDSYINAGFRSYYSGEVYLFMRNEYVLLDYAPGTTKDKVLNGPHLICDSFPSLRNTAFAEYGLDCAFGSHDSKEAYIFTGNLCARINYAPRTKDDYIIKGPMTIAQMFPFFKGTGFDNGVDAAFESSTKYEAYVFKGNRYALINYKEPRLIGGPKKITDGFYSLKGTIFESGMEAAFASHTSKEAYLFKGDQYALINFGPGGTNDYIINGPKKITPNWPSLATVLPHKNHCVDVHDHSKADPNHGHDEL